MSEKEEYNPINIMAYAAAQEIKKMLEKYPDLPKDIQGDTSEELLDSLQAYETDYQKVLEELKEDKPINELDILATFVMVFSRYIARAVDDAKEKEIIETE